MRSIFHLDTIVPLSIKFSLRATTSNFDSLARPPAVNYSTRPGAGLFCASRDARAECCGERDTAERLQKDQIDAINQPAAARTENHEREKPPRAHSRVTNCLPCRRTHTFYIIRSPWLERLQHAFLHSTARRWRSVSFRPVWRNLIYGGARRGRPLTHVKIRLIGCKIAARFHRTL